MPKTIGHWCRKLQTELERKGRKNWEGDYWKILKRLPQGEPLTKPKLLALIDATEPNTKTRARACMAIAALCKTAGSTFDPSPYRGNYSPNRAKSRQIPEDEQILTFWDSLQNQNWRWVLGMIATYGLRPHEAFFASIDREGVCFVSEGKTGPRDVWPLHPEWVGEFGLAPRCLPAVKLTGRTHEQIGHSATRHFWEIQTPFTLYDLRHAYALRGLEYGIENADVARWMGHSVDVHTKLYQKWIDRKRDRRAFERAMGRGDRPLPPGRKHHKNQ